MKPEAGVVVGGGVLARFMEQNGFDHAREDLGNVDAHYLRDHLGEADTVLQRLRLNEEVVGELVELPDDLEEHRETRGNPCE